MTLSTNEIESLRTHLGYGNLTIAALPYTADGFWTVFGDIVSKSLGVGVETSSSTACVAGAVTTITVASLGAIVAYDQLVIDVADSAEIVTVQSVAGATLTAKFANAHSGTYPVATMSGKARLRLLLWDADAAWRAVTDSKQLAGAGIKSVDKDDVVWFELHGVSKATLAAYQDVVRHLSQLVRVPSVWQWTSTKGSTSLEAY